MSWFKSLFNKRQSKQSRKEIYRLAISLSATFVLIVLSGCNGTLPPLPTATFTPSTSPTLTRTPTPTTCPTVSVVVTPEQVSLKPRLIVILFDTDRPPRPMEYADGQTTFDILEFALTVLQKVAQAGDQVAIFRLGHRENDDNSARILNHDSPTLRAPSIPVTPSRQPALTPLSTPTYARTATLFELTQNARIYQTAAAVQFPIATEMHIQDVCAQEDWKQRYSATNANWESVQLTAQSSFMTQIAATLIPYRTQAAKLPTPYAPQVVFEGLRHATTVFEKSCGSNSIFSECVLIIFDDLEEWRVDSSPLRKPVKPPEIKINLSNVKVVAVMLRCVDIDQLDCTKVQEKWNPEFKSYGISGNVKYLNGKRLEMLLVDYLRR